MGEHGWGVDVGGMIGQHQRGPAEGPGRLKPVDRDAVAQVEEPANHRPEDPIKSHK